MYMYYSLPKYIYIVQQICQIRVKWWQGAEIVFVNKNDDFDIWFTGCLTHTRRTRVVGSVDAILPGDSQYVPPHRWLQLFFAANLNQFQLSIEFNDSTFGVGQQILKSKYFDLAQLEYCNQKIKSVKLTFSMLSERALYVRERRRRRSEEVEISSPY